MAKSESFTRDFFRHLFRRPFEARALIEQLDNVGYRSLNVVNLTAIFSGMVLALQMGQFLYSSAPRFIVSRRLWGLLTAARDGSGARRAG